MAQLYPRALCFLFVASYDSQGCGGDILTRLHTGNVRNYIHYIGLLLVASKMKGCGEAPGQEETWGQIWESALAATINVMEVASRFNLPKSSF
jgi:hypothetical protein